MISKASRLLYIDYAIVDSGVEIYSDYIKLLYFQTLLRNYTKIKFYGSISSDGGVRFIKIIAIALSITVYDLSGPKLFKITINVTLYIVYLFPGENPRI